MVEVRVASVALGTLHIMVAKSDGRSEGRFVVEVRATPGVPATPAAISVVALFTVLLPAHAPWL